MLPIFIPNQLWIETWEGLRERGRLERETACIWGGRRSASEQLVERVYFFDDFGEVESYEAYHRAPVKTVAAIFRSLRENGHAIIADVHTHPGEWVGLSDTDKAHPIEYRSGLIAIVIPSLAADQPSLKVVGIHKYMGNGRWLAFWRCRYRRILRIV